MTGQDHQRPPENPVPAVPIPMGHLPVAAGLAVPWITPYLDGKHLFGVVDAHRLEHCLRQHRCGVCGRQLTGRVVFLMRESDLRRQYSAEPGLHPWCAAYTTQACPMIIPRQFAITDGPAAVNPRSLSSLPQV